MRVLTIHPTIGARLVAQAWGTLRPVPYSALMVAYCPACVAGTKQGMVACRFCGGEGKFYHVHGARVI